MKKSNRIRTQGFRKADFNKHRELVGRMPGGKCEGKSSPG